MKLLIALFLLLFLIIYETVIFFKDYRVSDKNLNKKVQLIIKIISLFLLCYIIIQSFLTLYFVE
ncbi:MAG: hypothetical protein AB1765_01645 [Candidatus Hydrogenedentota bacterium]